MADELWGALGGVSLRMQKDPDSEDETELNDSSDNSSSGDDDDEEEKEDEE